jgi:hypothetical protein
MLRQRGHRAGAHVARDADLQRHVLLNEPGHQRRIFDRAYPMPDALGADRERLPDARRTGGFARMAGVVETKNRGEALLRVRWVDPTLGLYGETVPIEVNGRRGSELFNSIMEAIGNGKLLRDTIVYLTCLRHALGLRHTREFADIMYSFQYGGDIPEYFGRYRRKLATREDIRNNSGISPADRVHLLEVAP